MTLYRIDFEQRSEATIYVEADTPEDARVDAWELAEDADFQYLDMLSDGPYVVSTDATGIQYWTGGEAGKWEIT